MFFRFFILFFCVLFLAGCFYTEEPTPMITHVGPAQIPSTPTAPVLLPKKKPANVPAGWLPPMVLESKGRWRGIVVHHSESSYGDAAHIHKYHKSKGWNGLGYHFVINNGVFRNGYGQPDGLVEVGYRWSQQKNGSHCRSDGDKKNYYNKHTIGICLIGNFERSRPTKRQWRSLVKLVKFLQGRYKIPTSQIKGHREIKPTKCPGRKFSISLLRKQSARGG